MQGLGLAEPESAEGMIKSKHRRAYLVDRISSSLRDAAEKPSDSDLPAPAGASAGPSASYSAQVALAAAVLIGFLAIPLGILYLLLS